MANEKLTVELLADDKDLDTGFKKSTATVQKFDESIKTLSKNSVKSISSMQLQLQSYQRIAEKATDPKILASYNAKIEQVEKSIFQATNIGKTGFDALGNAIDKTSGSLGGKLYSGLKTAANILPGVGIAGILAFATGPIIDYVSHLDLFIQKISDAKQAQLALIDALNSKEYANTIQNVSELTINLDLAKKGMYDKTAVVKQYNETIGATAGQVKTLDEVERGLTANGEKYIKMQLYKAAANLQLAEAAKKAVEVENLRLKSLNDFKNVVVDTRVSSGGVGGGTGAFNADEYKRETDRIKKAQTERKNAAIKVQQDAENQQLKIARSFQEKAAEQAKSMGGVLGSDLSETKTKKVKATIPVVPKLEIPNNAATDAKEFEKYFKQLSGGKALNVDPPKIELNGEFKPLDLGTPITFDEKALDREIAKLKLSDKLDAFQKQAELDVQQLTSIQSVLEDVSGAMSQGFGSIGSALVDGSSIIDAAGTALLGTISSFISELGAALIKQGAATIAAGIALNLITPGSGAGKVAGGIALIGAGGALSVAGGAGSAMASRKNNQGNTGTARKFANGGIIYGPTMGLMGEYAGASNNPEVVAPLNKLQDLLPESKGGSVFIPEMRLGNDAIYVAFKRGEKQQNRI